jgi:cob(I)alamin adenosyltransferase
MKVYTGTGDRGKTSLFSGERVSKHSDRIEAYGEVDELNSVIGALIASFSGDHTKLLEELHAVQSDLLRVGAWLSTTPGSQAMDQVASLDASRVQFLEKTIDRMDGQLEPLANFILPGGHPTAAWAHLARTVCRRTERRVLRLPAGSYEGEYADQFSNILVYLNRLSDYFFVLARFCNNIVNVSDTIWKE